MPRYDVWAEGVIGRQNTAGGCNDFAILHVGADYLLTPQLLAGLAVQFDWADFNTSASDARADGFGFMVGPYLTARLTDNFYLDGRATWGKSFNKISPLGTYEDDADGERFLVSAAVIGDFNLNGFGITPELRLNYFGEETQSYTDTLGFVIPSYSVEAGTLEFGPSINKTFELENGLSITPELSLKGIWTFKQSNTAKLVSGNGVGFAGEGLRAQIGIGASISAPNDFDMRFNANYDGIGEYDYEAWSARLQVSKRW